MHPVRGPMQNPPFSSIAPKMEIVNLLAARKGFRRYLELCTSTTGNQYSGLDRDLFSTAHRLMYNCPAKFDDGQAVDFRSEDANIDRCLAEIARRNLKYDIVLVDGWHEYETSKRDLEAAMGLIGVGGFLVVHDCLPPSAAIATPRQRPGDWCGVTYKAYLDFVGERSDLDYCTVDTDFGCGIVRKLDGGFWRRGRRRLAGAWRRRRAPWKQWYEIGDDFERAFTCMQENKTTLLRLIGPDEFLATLDRRLRD